MGSLPEVSPDLVLEHCHLHTSTRRNGEPLDSEVINVVVDGGWFSGSGHPFHNSEELVQAAWALLLRRYLGNDIVCFAILDDRQKYRSIKTGTVLKPSITGVKTRILQYCIPAQCRVKDLRPIGVPAAIEQVSETASINTAILFSASSKNRQDGDSGFVKPKYDSLARKFDVLLNLNEVDETSTSLSIRYRRPKVSNQYAKFLACTLQKILEEMTLHVELEVRQLDCVSEVDKQMMLAWNPKVLYSQMTCVHYLVEAVARGIPCSEAVCAWDGSLTYAQLDLLSSNAAQDLIRVGVGVGYYVPFAFEKTLWTVVATLAILKAGAAFVPLDPTHPKARLQEILKNIKADVIVTSSMHAATFRDVVNNVIIVSEQTVSWNSKEVAGEYGWPIVQSSDPVFVLFTSGSTGKPKGMIHEHGAICTHAIAHGKAMRYQGARTLQFAAHTFDVAIIDIYTTLIYGGCICIPSDDDRMNNLTTAINSMKANHAILTPSFANLIDPDDVPTMQILAIGGEALTRDRIQRWADKVSLIQIYGPAEVGICLIMDMNSRDTSPETIGYPLHNSSCWLVDPENPNLLVPAGAVGELVVAGPSLANSYLNDDAKTRSSFVSDLTWSNALQLKFRRFYRTGDLLRYNVDALDGSYDFVGRKDTQIKLRGQRLETGDVEHSLASIPGVAVSMVTRPEDGCFAGKLVAVVQMRRSQPLRVGNRPITITPEQSLSVETVKEHLSKSLPAYMCPEACLEITSMPFVPSMKINRRMVDAWLTNMRTRPDQVAAAMLNDLGISPLDPSEVIANVLSAKYAELVASNDYGWLSKLRGSDFYLQKAGIDSIQIVSLSMFLKKVYAVKIPISRLLNSTMTIRDLANLVIDFDASPAAHNSHTTVDVLRESRMLREELLKDIEARRPDTRPGKDTLLRNVLLTGASGYLGLAIVQSLMMRPGIFVFALVRCTTESEGLQRMIDAARTGGWWQESYISRLHVWKGDLTEDNLGLNDKHLRRLRGIGYKDHACIHAVIHNGAKVHYHLDYQSLKAVNVTPTLQLLKTVAKAVHLSTFVYVSGGLKPCVDTRSDYPPLHVTDTNPGNGYTQSKFVSEDVVRHCTGHASFQDKNVLTIKPGYIIGSLAAGIAKQTDFIWRLIAGCIEVQAYNHDEKARWLFIADVDSVAERVIAGVFESHQSPDNTEPILDGLLFSDLWGLLTQEFGYCLKPLPHDRWLERLHAAVAAKQESHLLYPLLQTLETEGGALGSTQIPNVENRRTRDAVEKNVRHLIEVGFLPAPPQRTGSFNPG